MRWFLVPLLLLLIDAPARTEDVGAKAIFKNPALNVLTFSPRKGEVKPPPRKPESRMPPSAPPSAFVGRPQVAPPTAEPVRSIGIRTWIRRVDPQGRALGEMGVGHVFRTGERVQLLVESNTEAYLAVVQQGSDGRAGLLFPPNERDLGTERIPAHAKVVLPGPLHAFTFDQQAGTERLWIVLVRDRTELAALPLRRDMSLVDLEVVRRVATRELGAKNLLIEALTDPEDDPGIYTVNVAGNSIVQEIALVHEK